MADEAPLEIPEVTSICKFCTMRKKAPLLKASFCYIFIAISCCAYLPLVTAFSAAPPAISIDNLSCSHDGGTNIQLQDVSYVLTRGQKVGLTGRNGCGKSTLLRILAESCCPDNGAVQNDNIVYTGSVSSPRNVRVAFVEQEPPLSSDVTVGDALLGVVASDSTQTTIASSGGGSLNTVFETVRRYRMAEATSLENPEQFAEASAEMDARGGWNVLTKADEVATRLRVRHLQDKALSSLSGGERKRVALAAALVQDPDVLLLDEPTNHLDLSAIQWLADLLLDARRDLTLLLVSHDRAFLEQVCNNILELDEGSLYQYEGNYQAYLQGKQERLANQDAAVSSAKAKYRVELEWMRRQPQARESKSKARIDAFAKLQKAIKPRPSEPNLRIEKDGQQRLGTKVLEMKHVSLKFGDKVMLDDFSYEFCRGDKIGICGANGVGKSTFIKIITGQQPIDSGEIVLGDTVFLGVYDQMGLTIENESQTVLDFVLEKVQAQGGAVEMSVAPNEARKLLNQFEFPRQRWQTRVSMLSGGEKRRLQLLSVLSKKPNMLILDEPSNDIDLNTLTALEKYLADWNGVLIVVSHDRYFTDKVTNHLFVFEGNGAVLDYAGSLSEYADCLIENENAAGMEGSGDIGDSTAKKEAYREDKEIRNERRNAIREMKKEMKNIENALERLKPKAVDIQHEIDSSSDEGWTVLADLTEKLHAINEEIDEKELRWLELAEQLEAPEAKELV